VAGAGDRVGDHVRLEALLHLSLGAITVWLSDLTLVRDRVVWVELKTETGKVSAAQREWLDALKAAGAEAYIWRPSDLERVGQVLGRREAKAAA
jgi:VRR-NUC domain-containing protein